MAARRLLIIMLVLLGISSVLAIALPKPERNDSSSQETAVTGETGATGVTGETGGNGSQGAVAGTGPDEAPPARARTGPGGVATETIELGEKTPSQVKAKVGTRMIITVNSLEGSEVEIEGLGLAGFADRYAPAVFDVIFPTEPGRYRVGAPGEKPSAVIVTS